MHQYVADIVHVNKTIDVAVTVHLPKRLAQLF
jgi:hypothetical protein